MSSPTQRGRVGLVAEERLDAVEPLGRVGLEQARVLEHEHVGGADAPDHVRLHVVLLGHEPGRDVPGGQPQHLDLDVGQRLLVGLLVLGDLLVLDRGVDDHGLLLGRRRGDRGEGQQRGRHDRGRGRCARLSAWWTPPWRSGSSGTSSLGHESAVDDHLRPRHERRLVGGEEQRGVRDVARLADPSEGDSGLELRPQRVVEIRAPATGSPRSPGGSRSSGCCPSRTGWRATC